MKSKLGKSLGLAMAAFSLATAAGCSGGNDGLIEDVVNSQSEFQAQAEELLEKSGVKPVELREFERFGDADAVALMQYVITSPEGTGKGLADVSCSAREVLHAGTHCQIASVRMGGME